MTPTRPITHRTAGRRHGPITRLVSPGDLGALIKPFVFLDMFTAPLEGLGGFGWHPHSGIATITTSFSGTGWYEDSTGKAGELGPGSIEWMRAGGGVWHTGGPLPNRSAEDERVAGVQLWLALPPALESAEPESLCIAAEDVPVVGPARVILGRYDGAESPIPAVADLTYLQISLRGQERWTYNPPPGHSVLWLGIHTGALSVSGETLGCEVAVFAPSEAPITVEAIGETRFVLGSAMPHPDPLVLGYYSVHTSEAALVAGEAEIQRVRRRLQSEGRL